MSEGDIYDDHNHRKIDMSWFLPRFIGATTDQLNGNLMHNPTGFTNISSDKTFPAFDGIKQRMLSKMGCVTLLLLPVSNVQDHCRFWTAVTRPYSTMLVVFNHVLIKNLNYIIE